MPKLHKHRKLHKLRCQAPGCARTFSALRSDAKTCSTSCRKALSRVTPSRSQPPPVVKVGVAGVVKAGAVKVGAEMSQVARKRIVKRQVLS